MQKAVNPQNVRFFSDFFVRINFLKIIFRQNAEQAASMAHNAEGLVDPKVLPSQKKKP
jgi:hypothetical protein